jgi:hypothetical protein
MKSYFNQMLGLAALALVVPMNAPDATAFMASVAPSTITVECFAVDANNRLDRRPLATDQWSGVGSRAAAEQKRKDMAERLDRRLEAKAKNGARVRCRGQLRKSDGSLVSKDYWTK